MRIELDIVMHMSKLFFLLLNHIVNGFFTSAVSSLLRTSDTTFFISFFLSPSIFLQPIFLHLILLPIFHRFIHQKCILPFPIFPFRQTPLTPLAMTTFSLSIHPCPKMWAKKSPSSLLTSIRTATGRSSAVIFRSKAPTFLYTKFESAIANSCWCPWGRTVTTKASK